MAKDHDEMDDLEKYAREHEEGDGDGEYDEEDFEDQLFCTGMINDAEGYDLKVEFFAAPDPGDTSSKVAIRKQINDWLHESRGVVNQKTGKSESVMVSRSIKKVLQVGEWIMVWYWEAF